MSVNKVILIGNVGRDPEVKYFDNGNAVANFTLATTERGYTAGNGTQIPDRAEWHNIVCWRGLAKIAEQYVRKGSPIYLEGKIRTRNYDDPSGNKRYITEIYVDNLELLGRKKDESAPTGGYNQQPMTQNIQNNQTPPPSFDSEEDDLPF